MKKRLIAFILTLVFTFGIAGIAMAEDQGVQAPNATVTPAAKVKPAKISKSLIKELRNLTRQNRKLHQDIKAKDKQIKSLIRTDRKNKATDKITEAKVLNGKAKEILTVVKNLKKSQKEDLNSLREARKSGNQEATTDAVKKVIQIQKQINQKLRELLKVRQEQINVLR